MPEHSDDYRVWTVRIRPGIYFADDPAFKGRKRELVAQDYVYTFKRFADPANKSPAWSGIEQEKLVGLAALREAALAGKKAFDYDREIEGARALDRYTVQFKVEQPRPLSFVSGQSDWAWRVGYQFVNIAMPNGKVAPNLAKIGIRGYRVAEPAHNYLMFNMEDATVGGYAPQNIALRRAVSLGMDTDKEIAYAYNGQAKPAQSPYWPGTSGYRPDFKSEFSEYDPARAKALLDMYGYV